MELQLIKQDNQSKSAYLYRLLSVQEYLLEEMKAEEDIFIVQDYQKAIFRIDDAISLIAGDSKKFQH